MLLKYRPIWLFLIFVIFISMIVEWRPWHSTTAEAIQSTSLTKNDFQKNTAGSPASDTKKEIVNSIKREEIIRAQLSAVNYTTVTSELSAKVNKFNFREGEKFKKGHVLIEFDCGAQQAQYQKNKAQLSITERNFTTNKKLLELGSVSRIEYENSQSEFQKSKAEVDELLAILSRCNLKAPFDGRVAEQKIRAEQFVQSGQALLEIIDNSALELEFVVPSKWSSWITENFQFKLHVDETDKDYPAKVTQVGARIDSISQTMKIRAAVKGDYPELRPGMSGSLNIEKPDLNGDKS